ncbi:SRPBCC family protein [Alteribacillus sp. HJP-4]|uniref:SRPBCC family protein n=1 Tax=Alteribacillus sp. HJP-4 TaxID=2775394 RepID=UPI0035CCE664
MYNLTKMKINKSVHEVFEAFVDPEKIGHFWFSSSSERWEQGKKITLIYEEYNAEGQIDIVEIEKDRKIVFEDDGGHRVTMALEELDTARTIIEVKEEGFDVKDEEVVNQLIDNKEGWVYMLTCLKGYLEYGADLRAALVK